MNVPVSADDILYQNKHKYIYIYIYVLIYKYIWYDHHPELSWTMRNDHPSILTFKEINKRQKGLGSLAQEQRSVVLTLAKQKHEPSFAMFCCWTGEKHMVTFYLAAIQGKCQTQVYKVSLYCTISALWIFRCKCMPHHSHVATTSYRHIWHVHSDVAGCWIRYDMMH